MGRARSPLRGRVIFVEGSARSGTTWLVTLLATHPQIAGVQAESHLFDFGVDRLFDNLEGRDPSLHGLNSYLDREELVDLTRDLCDGVFLAMRAHVSGDDVPKFVVEKTPTGARPDGLDLQRKRDCYPDAWFIHIVRDRAAVVRSLMRAPFSEDRSPAACGAIWDRSVGGIRGTLGGLPRYREVSYEQLRRDPVEECGRLLTWLGVERGEDELETIRLLSRERFSDMGAVPHSGGGSPLGGVGWRAMGWARAHARRKTRAADAVPALAFTLTRALRERDADVLRSLTHDSFEFVCRGADGDASLAGEEARTALVALAEETFARRYVGEWWASAGGGPGEWWTAAPGKPFWSVFFSALGGDATRVDVALGMVLEEGTIGRLVVITAGRLTGRSVRPDTSRE